jgi:small redox-active disulfide protein 2
MKIEILGSGCAKCTSLYESFKAVIAELGVECELEKVGDINKIVAMGVMMTPGVVKDGKVVAKGKMLSKPEIVALLTDKE